MAEGCVLGDITPLVGGTSPSEGLVEVCFGMAYRTVDLDSFRVYEAGVLCRQMGLGSGQSNVVLPIAIT